MKSKPALAAALAVLLFASGCATRNTSSGGKETTVLGGAVTVATVTAPPSTVVSLPPLDVLRVAHPDANRRTARAAARAGFDFMGRRRGGTLERGEKFRKSTDRADHPYSKVLSEG